VKGASVLVLSLRAERGRGPRPDAARTPAARVTTNRSYQRSSRAVGRVCDVQNLGPARLVALAREPEHCEVVACATREYKQMPDQMAITHPRIGCEEGDTDGVKQAAREQPQ